MKHIKYLLGLAIATLSLSASALSFDWGSSAAIKFDGTSLKSDDTVKGYLFYLGNGESATLATSYDISSGLPSVGTSVSEKTGTTNLSKITGTYTFDFGTKVNGDTFAMLLVYTGAADGKTYYNLSSTTYTLAGIADETSSLDKATFAFKGDKADDASSVKPNGGWTAVPEPSTAALALAGLALLLKRRKA